MRLVPVESDERLAIEQVSEHEMAMYCRTGHPLAGGKTLSSDDLDQFPLVSIRVPGGLADAIPGKALIDPKSGDLVPAMEIDDFATARTVVANSNGIGTTIPTQIASQLASGELTLLNLPRPWLLPVFGFILMKNRALGPAAEVFMETVSALEKDACRRNAILLEKYLG